MCTYNTSFCALIVKLLALLAQFFGITNRTYEYPFVIHDFFEARFALE